MKLSVFRASTTDAFWWQNVRTSLAVLAVGACLGWAAKWAAGWASLRIVADAYPMPREWIPKPLEEWAPDQPQHRFLQVKK